MKCGISEGWLPPFSDALTLYFYITNRNWNPKLKNKNESARGWKVSKNVASHLHACDIFVLCYCQSSSPSFMLSWRSYGYEDSLGLSLLGLYLDGVNQLGLSRVFSFHACNSCLQPWWLLWLLFCLILCYRSEPIEEDPLENCFCFFTYWCCNDDK